MSDQPSIARRLGCPPLKFLTVRTVAARLNVDVSTVRRMIYDGRLDATKVRGDWRVHSDSLDSLLEA